MKGCVLWLTGLPSAGKSTISQIVYNKLKAKGIKVELLDGDEVRKNLSPDLGFTKVDRETHAKRVTYVSKLLARNGVIAIVALISPYRSFREAARQSIGDFVEVFVNAPLDECIKRDVKGLYKKALAGEIKDMTGVQDTYEEPANPEITIYSHKVTPEEAADSIMKKLHELGFIN
ncbi:MAG TPA: adenylyl-sulfate kinase [Nitrososphaera sp.]|jgi:adenylylsulfate kinase|nr:adenylyl-sulfate kinase [Nitrososphaera sp.]